MSGVFGNDDFGGSLAGLALTNGKAGRPNKAWRAATKHPDYLRLPEGQRMAQALQDARTSVEPAPGQTPRADNKVSLLSRKMFEHRRFVQRILLEKALTETPTNPTAQEVQRKLKAYQVANPQEFVAAVEGDRSGGKFGKLLDNARVKLGDLFKGFAEPQDASLGKNQLKKQQANKPVGKPTGWRNARRAMKKLAFDADAKVMLTQDGGRGFFTKAMADSYAAYRMADPTGVGSYLVRGKTGYNTKTKSGADRKGGRGQTMREKDVISAFNAASAALRKVAERRGKASKDELKLFYGDNTGLIDILGRISVDGNKQYYQSWVNGPGDAPRDQQTAKQLEKLLAKGGYAKGGPAGARAARLMASLGKSAKWQSDNVKPRRAALGVVAGRRAPKGSYGAVDLFPQNRARMNPGVFGDMGDMSDLSGLALTNPGVFGGLALTNSTVEGASEFGKYALGAAGGAAVATVVHMFAVPYIDDLVEEYLPEQVAAAWDHVNYLLSGAAVGALLGFGAYKVGGQVGKYAGLIASGALAAGGVLQVLKHFGALSEEGIAAKMNPFSGSAHHAGHGEFGGLGRLAHSNPGIFGGITVEPPPVGVFGGIGVEHGRAAHNGVAMDANAGISGNYRTGGGSIVGYAPYAGLSAESQGATNFSGAYGDGMAFMLAPLTGGYANLYGEINTVSQQSTMGDAYYSGADFSTSEGQALVNGPEDFVNRFGMASTRISSLGGKVGQASHLAGKEGWRWGWLIKMIGFENAQKLASLPPAQRLLVLKQMREKALDAYKAGVANLSNQEISPEVIASQVGQGNDSDPYAVELANKDKEFAGLGYAGLGYAGLGSADTSDNYGAMFASGPDYL